MQEALTLALEFLDEHPDSAVRILEQHDAHQVATFLETVPEGYSALVLGRALPAFAAHLCRAFGNETAARLLLQQDVGRMVAVLRHLEHMHVEAILNECPQARRQACVLRRITRLGKCVFNEGTMRLRAFWYAQLSLAHQNTAQRRKHLLQFAKLALVIGC